MSKNGSTVIALTALAGAVAIGIQVALILLQGEAYCPNEGCKVVEGLTNVSPLLFNLVGLGYFLSILLSTLRPIREKIPFVDATALLLLAGLVVEGVLLSYQLYVARTFCAYCLLVLALVATMNIVKGREQMVRGVCVFVAVLTAFPLLSFGPSFVLSRYRSLDGGTYAVRTCSIPTKELYLFFSANCPHCRNVLDVLEDCNSCTLHFNPVEPIDTLELPGIELTESYSPDVNRLMLTLLGIDEIPVLLVKGQDGFYVIHGDTSIIGYVREACFQAEPLLYLEPSLYPGAPDVDLQDIDIFEEEDEGCSLKIECEEE